MKMEMQPYIPPFAFKILCAPDAARHKLKEGTIFFGGGGGMAGCKARATGWTAFFKLSPRLRYSPLAIFTINPRRKFLRGTPQHATGHSWLRSTYMCLSPSVQNTWGAVLPNLCDT